MMLSVPLLVAALNGAAGAPLAPNDFAYGLRLEPQAGAPVQDVVVPEVVYRWVQRSDLGDLRLFDGRGEPLPLALGASSDVTALRVAPQRLSLFRLPDEAKSASSLAVMVRRNTDGAVVEVRGAPSGTVATEALYLADAAGLVEAMTGLELAWAPGDASISAQLDVEASDDLVAWQTLARGVPLLRLRQGTQVLEQRRVALARTQARYLRLRLHQGAALPLLIGVTAELSGRTHGPAPMVATFAKVSQDGEEPHYELPTALPIDQVRLIPRVGEALLAARLLSAATPAGPWTERASGMFFRLRRNGDEVTGPLVASSVAHHRYWRATALVAGVSLAKRDPVLEVAWRPQRLVFVVQGPPPLTLAFGSLRAEPSFFAESELRGLVSGGGDDAVEAHLGTELVTLGGETLLQPPAPPWPWRKVALWGVLVAGVAVLALMATKLARQMSQSGG